tara:strand:+ start:105 stop:413 length:309 start_codon:yes stop_codon:yes gene_type:complete
MEKTSTRKDSLFLSKHQSHVVLQALAEVHNLYISLDENGETTRGYSHKDMRYAIANMKSVYDKWKNMIDFAGTDMKGVGLSVKRVIVDSPKNEDINSTETLE